MSGARTDGNRLPRIPALDGLRAVAVGAVLLFHSGFSWARGGHLGVTVFFTLSGFLITALLLRERDLTGAIDLRAFWRRRARRLVPASLLCSGLAVAYLLFSAERDREVLGDGLAASFWLANWRFVHAGASYEAMFREPSPFRHFWSLAVEEQIYIGLPVLALLAAGVGRGRGSRGVLAAMFAIAAALSTLAAWRLHVPGGPALRAYYGTDARAAEPMVGALLACLLVGPHGVRRLPRRAVRALSPVAVVAGMTLIGLITRLDTTSEALFRGGFVLSASLAAVVLAAATQPTTLVARVLSAEWLQSIGRISYGVYLYHWPIFLWIDEESAPLPRPALFALRTTVTFALAWISYEFVEQPVRQGRLPRRIGAVGWANATVALTALLVLASGVVPLPARPASQFAAGNVAEAPGTAVEPRRPPNSRSAPSTGITTPAATGPVSVVTENASVVPRATAPDEATGDTSQPPGRGQPVSPTPAPAARAPGSALRIAVIGDSVGENLATGLRLWGEPQGIRVLDLTVRACPVSRGGQRRLAPGHMWPIPEDCDWWDDYETRNWFELQLFDADVIVVEDGLNELPDRRLDHWAAWMKPGDPVFDTWLVREYRSLIDTVAQRNIGLLLVNAPCADFAHAEGWNKMTRPDQRIRSLNTVVYRELATSASKVADLHAFACPGGEFSDVVGGVDDARPDGVHFTDEAAKRIAEKLLAPQIAELASARRG